MKFDWTVNAGNVLTAFGLLIGFIAAHIQNVKRLAAIEMKVQLMYDWFRTHVIRIGGSDE